MRTADVTAEQRFRSSREELRGRRCDESTTHLVECAAGWPVCTAMSTPYASLRVLVCCALVSIGCGSEASAPNTTATDGATADTATEGDAPATDTNEATDTKVAEETAPTTTKVTLEIQSATYKASTAAGGGFVHAVVFTIANTSAVAVTSLETLVFDFGGGQKVELTKPACSGMFPIAAGGKRLVDTQVVVSTSGSLSNFSFICGSSQRFGGASGKAPPSATFSDPIAITIGGTTESGTFTGTGSATPK